MKKSVYINLLFTILIGLLGFVTNSIFAQKMGTENLGLLKLFTQLIAYLNLVDLGIASASAFALYKPLQENNKYNISIVLSTISDFYRKIAISIIFIGFIICFLLNEIISNEVIDSSIYIYWMLFVLSTSLSYTYTKYVVLFTADHEYSFVRVVQGSMRIIMQLIQIAVIYELQSFFIFSLLLSLEHIANYYCYSKFYKRKYKDLIKTNERDTKIIKDMKKLFFHSLSGVIVFSSDYIILTKFTNLEVVAKYASYLMISQMILMLTNIVTPIITPYIGRYIVTTSQDKIFTLWLRMNAVYIFFGTVIVATCYYTINQFVLLWMGDTFVLSMTTVMLILINIFLQVTRIIIEVFKNSCGYFRDIYNPILEAALNLILSIILVEKMGLNGVIIGTIVSNVIVVHFTKVIAVFKNCFDKGIVTYVYIYTRNILLFSMTFLFVYNLLPLFISLDVYNWYMWVLLLLKVFCFVFSVSLFVFLFDINFRSSLKFMILNLSKSDVGSDNG